MFFLNILLVVVMFFVITTSFRFFVLFFLKPSLSKVFYLYLFSSFVLHILEPLQLFFPRNCSIFYSRPSYQKYLIIYVIFRCFRTDHIPSIFILVALCVFILSSFLSFVFFFHGLAIRIIT